MNKSTLLRFLTLALSVAILCSMFISVSAATTIPDNVPNTIIEEDSEISPRAEEIGWIFRINNGYYEKRLWSYTYGKWLTDWIVLNPVE